MRRPGDCPLTLCLYDFGGRANRRAEGYQALREKELRIALVCFGGISLAVYMHGISKEILKLVRASSALHAISDRAKRAHDLGLDGLVCSAAECSALHLLVGNDMVLVTPGIRPAGAAAGDQKRIMTPAAALAAGADHLVVGRPILAAPDPRAAADAIIAEIAGVLP